MSDWIGLAFLILFAAAAWLGLRAVARPRKLSAQEFERRVGEGRGLINAGMMEMDKFLNPRAGKSIETVRELKDGRYNQKRQTGDGQNKAELE